MDGLRRGRTGAREVLFCEGETGESFLVSIPLDGVRLSWLLGRTGVFWVVRLGVFPEVLLGALLVMRLGVFLGVEEPVDLLVDVAGRLDPE